MTIPAVSIADANFLLGWRNHVLFRDDATLDAPFEEITAGTIDALRTMQLSDRVTMTETIETEGAATLQIHWAVSSDEPVAVQLIGLLNYTLSAPGATDVSWSITIAKAGGGALSDEPIAVYNRPSEDFPSHVWAILDEEIDDAYDVIMSVSASFGSGGGTLTLSIGGLWLSELWTLPKGIAAGWSQVLEDSGVLRRSKGNQGYARRGNRYRRFRGRAIDVPFEYAYGSDDDPDLIDIQQLLYRVGTTEPVVLFPRTRRELTNPRSVHVMHRLGLYCHFERLGEIAHVKADLYQWTGVEVAELM